MVLLLHIIFAYLSIGLAIGSIAFPSKMILRFVYGSSAGAVISGVILGIMTPHTNITQACISGFVFIGFIVGSSFITHRRLATTASK